jgi:hypothetical protein
VDLQGNVNKIHNVGHQLHRMLSVAAGELMDLRMDSLEETVNAEEQVRTEMADTIQREKELSASVSKMRSDLAQLRLDMESEIALKDQKLADFKDKLVNQRHDVTIMLSYMSKDAAANKQTTRRHWARRVAELTAEIATTEQMLQEEQISHATQVGFLQAKIEAANARKLLTEHINEGQTPQDLRTQGVQDPKELEARKEFMAEEREKLLRELLELQDKYDLDVTRRALLAEAQRKEREEEAARAAGEQRAMEAAIVLECAYRVHLARVALDDVKNPKKKGKKGKKKK